MGLKFWLHTPLKTLEQLEQINYEKFYLRPLVSLWSSFALQIEQSDAEWHPVQESEP